MIKGHVNEFLELVIPVISRGPTGIEKQIEFILDTGFSSSITLPKYVIDDLQLSNPTRTRAMLADGTIRHYQNYELEIYWNGQWCHVVALCLGEETLLGTRLLAGHELQASFVISGEVKIKAIG